MGKPYKLKDVPVPEGMTVAEYLAMRLNELGSTERLASELGVSFKTAFDWCKQLHIKKRAEYFVGEADHAPG